mmetsp:Transcript_29231/g.52894  ORF Transcript_29231/g.52894 Transcript_29231/m.52894 type:complete len:121 (-) Transcript_29231:376-738(-)
MVRVNCMIMKAESSPGALLHTDISCITRDSLDEETVAKPIFLSIHHERKRKKSTADECSHEFEIKENTTVNQRGKKRTKLKISNTCTEPLLQADFEAQVYSFLEALSAKQIAGLPSSWPR